MTSRPARYQRREAAFTFIEIILVVVIIGAIAVMALPNFRNSLSRMQLKDAAHDLAYLIRYAQVHAISTQKDVVLTFNDQLNQYWLKENSAEQKSEFSRLTGRWGRTVSIPDTIAVGGIKESLRFYPDGNIEKESISLCSKDNCFIVSTKEFRGQVQIYDLQNQGL